jgi:cytochrome P450
VHYTVTVATSAQVMSLFPSFIQPYELRRLPQRQLIHLLRLIGMCLTHVKSSQRKAEQFLVPIIEERYRLPPEERPNDMLSWLMEDAVGEEREPQNLSLRILAVNFAAIHTTSMVSRFFLPYIRLTVNFP